MKREEIIKSLLHIAKNSRSKVEVVHGERSNYCPNCGAKMEVEP